MDAVTTLSAAEFFARAQSRLNLDVPPGLNDASITPKRGDHDADPIMQKIAGVAGSAAYVQLWLDTTYGTNVGGAMNDGIVALFGGTGTPQNIVDLMTAAAATK